MPRSNIYIMGMGSTSQPYTPLYQSAHGYDIFKMKQDGLEAFNVVAVDALLTEPWSTAWPSAAAAGCDFHASAAAAPTALAASSLTTPLRSETTE